MRKVTSSKYPGYLTYQLFVSEAFRTLKPATREILILVYYEVNFTDGTKRKKKYTPLITNRHDIKLPYNEITARLGYSHKTIWTAFKEILEHGFLKVVENGGGCKGDCKIYEISEAWRKWKPGQVINKIETNGKIGWQKGKK